MWETYCKIKKNATNNIEHLPIQYRSNFVVLATGQLNIPRYPSYINEQLKDNINYNANKKKLEKNISNEQNKNIKIMHTARWNSSVNYKQDFRNKTVAIVGNGSSGVQLLEEIQPYTKKIILFYRSPKWMLKRPLEKLPKFIIYVLKYGLPFQIILLSLRFIIFVLIEIIHIIIAYDRKNYINKLFCKLIENGMFKNQPNLKKLNLLPLNYKPGCNRLIIYKNYLKLINEKKCKYC